MKRVLVFLSIILLFSSTRAQVNLPSDQSKELGKTVYGLGLSAGVVSGFGLSFRTHFPSMFSFQIVAGIIKSDNKLQYNVGGLTQYDLIRGELTRFYACGGMGYFYSGESGKNELAGPFRTGLGIGAERGTQQAFNLSAELLFTYFSDGTILPLPQASIHYYFF